MAKFLLILGIFVAYVLADSGPIIQTHIGKFVGKTLDFGEKGKIDAYYGVPFARPPVGDKRFEKPVDADFVEKREALEQKPGCLQPEMKNLSSSSKDEDCLYLNIFKPQQASTSGKGHPVLFFVHGGGFQAGSAHIHSLDYVAEHYSTPGIVFIAPQYRLSIFGFASTGPEAFAGNYGLWDLRRALLWVRKNAKALDIDPNRITIAGYSAGSAAVGHLSVSEHSRDLFAQVIQMSGSLFADWATSNKAVILTEKIAQHLKCDSQSSASVKKCLRKFTYDQLYEAFKEAAEDKNDFNLSEFSPRLDADFFTQDIPELIASGKPKRTLATINENEGILFTAFGQTGIFDRHALVGDKFEKFGKKEFEKFVAEKLATEKIFGGKAEEVQKKIIKFYLGKEKNPNNHFYVEQYAKLVSDVIFTVPQLREMRLKSEAGWPVYMVKNVHWIQMTWAGPHGGIFEQTTHGQEYGLLFGLPGFYTTELTEKDNANQKALMDTIINFVKNGTPKTAEEPNFQPISLEHPLVYSELSTKVELKEPMFAEELIFWNELTNKYEFDLIRGIHKKSLRSRTEL